MREGWILYGPPLTDILVNTFLNSREHVRTTGGKKFYQHTVTLTIFRKLSLYHTKFLGNYA